MDEVLNYVRRIVPATETEFLIPGTVAFDPTTLFTGGYQGGWWDPSDMSTLFQDIAGTTPVTAAGQNVKRMNDKSGNGNNLTGNSNPDLANSGSLWWLLFDTVSKGGALALETATFALTQPFTAIHTWYLNDWSSFTTIERYEAASGFATMLSRRTGPSPEIGMWDGTYLSNNDATLGTPHVITEIWNAAATSKLAVDNNSYATATLNNRAVDRVALETANGLLQRYYGGIVINRVLTDPEIAQCRTFFGAKAGLSL